MSLDCLELIVARNVNVKMMLHVITLVASVFVRPGGTVHSVKSVSHFTLVIRFISIIMLILPE